MGICIGYRGKLSDPAVTGELVADLQGKARAAGWPSKTMEELLGQGLVTCAGLAGMTVYPHRECEPVHLHFDGDGTFVNHFYVGLLRDEKKAGMMMEALAESIALTRQLGARKQTGVRRPRGARRERGPASVRAAELTPPGAEFFKEGTRHNWTKTQFAGPRVHAAVCDLLRHVKARYAPDLEVTDDSEYFADGDYAKLEASFAYIERMVDLTTQAFATVTSGSSAPKTLDGLLDRVNAELAGARDKLH
jgi:hypothetical protein